MKRFENEKLHELVSNKYSYRKRLLDDTYHYCNPYIRVASEEDIAAYLCEELKMDVAWNSFTDEWLAFRINSKSGSNKSRNEAIFRCAELILEEG